MSKRPTRFPGGTRKIRRTVASFRTWRGLEVSAAPDPAGQEDGTRETGECQYFARELMIDLAEIKV
jgi:hypothetical protein